MYVYMQNRHERNEKHATAQVFIYIYIYIYIYIWYKFLIIEATTVTHSPGTDTSEGINNGSQFSLQFYYQFC